MRASYLAHVIPLLAALTLTSACTSKDQTAATAAAQADAEFQVGRYNSARRAILKAIAARDDVSDYWLLLARVNMMRKDYPGAFDAYQYVLQFDRSNLEAVRQLCQLALTVRQPDKADRFADQLLILNPQDPVALVAKGGAALQRADTTTALNFAERVLTVNPKDEGALILKGQILAFKQDYRGAIRFIEASFDASSDNTPRLAFLLDLYPKTGDFEGYSRAVRQLAQANPDDRDKQIAFADLLYQTGNRDEAMKVLRGIMARRSSDIGLAASVVELWLDEGADALAPAHFADANSLSLEMQAAFAQFANETARPKLALEVLGDAALGGDPTSANSDAKSAFAYAVGIGGNNRDGLAQLEKILEVDPRQPRALLARARLKAVAGDIDGAVSDARQVTADDPANITARIALSEILLRQNETLLATTNLREAIRAQPDAIRPVATLAKLLNRAGRAAEVRSLLQDLARAAPLNLRAKRLLKLYNVPPPAAEAT